MDQKKTGSFLKELRKEKKITQEQLAELFNVSGKTVSRWETGRNMPDLDLLIRLSDYYGVDIREILDGERRDGNMDKTEEETILKMADYSNEEKMRLTRRIHVLFWAGVAALAVFMILDTLGLAESGAGEAAAGFALGIVFGMLLIGLVYTSRYMGKIRAFKMRLINRSKN